MSLSEQAQVAIVDRLDFLEAANPVMYAALSRMKYLASADRLKTDDVLEVLAKIREIAKRATDAVDNCTFAEQKRGMEEADADVMRQLDAAGGYTGLSDEGKLKALAAKKRAEMASKKSLREHGTALLAINHAHAPLHLHQDPLDTT